MLVLAWWVVVMVKIEYYTVSIEASDDVEERIDAASAVRPFLPFSK